jgi:hypothetical protein
VFFYLKDCKIVDLGDVGKFKMGFKGSAEKTPELLSVKRNIQKFHINYQPSLKLKRQLKGHIEVSKDTKIGFWVSLRSEPLGNRKIRNFILL